MPGCYNVPMRDGSGSRRSRILVPVALLVLCGSVLAGGSARGATSSQADLGALNVTYTSATAFQVKLGNGTVVGNGSVVPAGSYQVFVYDASEDLSPKFAFSGPGVSLSSDLNSTGMGIDIPATFGPYTLATSSTYTMEDTTVGASTLLTFTTSATATASSGSSSSGSSSTSVSSAGTSSSSSSSSSSGSKSSSSATDTMMMGVLKGVVNARGKLTLTLGGKKLGKLEAGRYTVKVTDHSKKAGLILGVGSKKPITLSSAKASGSSSHPVTLTAGKWFFEASTRGPKTYFVVK
jgi:hypothetical protein